MTVPLPVNGNGVSVPMDLGRWSPVTFTPNSALLDDEKSIVDRLVLKLSGNLYNLELRDSYYKGLNRISDLGISIPPQMRGLRTTVGWPRVAVDALDRRLNVTGFHLNKSASLDSELSEIWLANDMDSDHTLAHLDALVFASGYVCVGSGEAGGQPILTVESPLCIAEEWDPRTRMTTAALRVWGDAPELFATLYLPDQTVSLESSPEGWRVIDRDVHRLGRCMIVKLVNRARSYDRDGSSEITPEIMSITDAACRTLLGLAVAGEFYSAPQRWIMGASESAFQNADGTPKTAWETYLGRVLALEPDEEGNVPTVGQFTAYDPSVYTKVIDSYAQRMSSLTGLPPHILGYTTSNPASADAIRSSEMELTRRADHKTVVYGKGWRDVMKLALLVRDGRLPADVDTLTTIWAPTSTPTIAATTDAVMKQVQMGYLPAESDVVGETLGYDPVQRDRIAADRKLADGQKFLDQLAENNGYGKPAE